MYVFLWEYSSLSPVIDPLTTPKIGDLSYQNTQEPATFSLKGLHIGYDSLYPVSMVTSYTKKQATEEFKYN